MANLGKQFGRHLLLACFVGNALAFSQASFAAPAATKPTPAKTQPAKAVAAPQETYPPVLDPGQFFGAASMGYTAAKAEPHVCAKLFCYCGCDITDSHKRLLDCFTSMHGVDCHICQEEALLALRMTRNGDSLSSIQKTIDDMYSSKYPFKEESPALKAYKSIRLWSAGAAPLPKGPGKGDKKASDADACCAAEGDHHKHR